MTEILTLSPKKYIFKPDHDAEQGTLSLSFGKKELDIYDAKQWQADSNRHLNFRLKPDWLQGDLHP
eukprot:scaffold52559_cov21-Tisochrysis_lutea.AAC.3